MRTNQNLAHTDESPSIRTSPPSVLVFDDSAMIRRTLVPWFRCTVPGWNVLEARSPQEALDLVIRAEPAVFICGHDLGGTSGTDLLASARSLYTELVGVLLVGSLAAEMSLDRENLAGVFRRLRGPWKLDHLVTLIGEAFAEHGRRVQLDETLSRYLSEETMEPSCEVSAGFRPSFAPTGGAPKALPR